MHVTCHRLLQDMSSYPTGEFDVNSISNLRRVKNKLRTNRVIKKSRKIDE